MRILLLLLFIPGMIFPQNKSQLQLDIDLLLKSRFFNSAEIAVDIYDLTDSEILYRKNEELLLRPASNLKLITSASGLVFLGPEYKYLTSVYHTGKIADSICLGDIYFVGGCDPDFTIDDLDYLAKQIKNSGIKEIKGNLYGDVSMLDSLFWGSGWMWDDEMSMDFPYFTPLIINDACIQIEYSPGQIGERANINVIPNTDYIKILNNSFTIKEDSSNFSIKRDWVNRNNNIIVSGNLFYNSEKDTIKTNIVNPESLFLNLTKQRLIANGIKFNGETQIKPLPQNSEDIYIFERRFTEILKNLNKTSDNLSAEMTLRALAFKYFGKPASAKNGIVLVDSLISLTGLNPSNYRIVDGSGVSHYNLISAELLTQLLKYIYRERQDLFQIFYDSLPIAGVDGTLKSRMKESSAFNNVHAKTGTLSGVSSLSGYLRTKENHLVAFSIIIQNYKGSSIKARAFQDEICKILSE